MRWPQAAPITCECRSAGDQASAGGRQQGHSITAASDNWPFTHFAAGSTVTREHGASASAVSMTDAKQSDSATITIAAGTATGATDEQVTTGAEVALAATYSL